MKRYVKPYSSVIKLKSEESLASTASTNFGKTSSSVSGIFSISWLGLLGRLWGDDKFTK